MKMACSVMSDRLLLTLLAITQASRNPWSIEFLYRVYEVRHLWKTLCISETHVDRLLSEPQHIYANTHSRPPSDCKMKLQEVQYWHAMTSTGSQNTCYTCEIPSIYWQREEGNTYSTVPRSPGKVEQEMEGSEYENVIGCDKEEVKRKGKHYWSILRGG